MSKYPMNNESRMTNEMTNVEVLSLQCSADLTFVVGPMQTLVIRHDNVLILQR